jgi:hypothetical protein
VAFGRHPASITTPLCAVSEGGLQAGCGPPAGPGGMRCRKGQRPRSPLLSRPACLRVTSPAFPMCLWSANTCASPSDPQGILAAFNAAQKD